MWLNKEVRQAINSKKKAFALLKQDGTIEALKNYREKNTLSKKLIKAAKKETEKHIAKESKTNPKLFFNYINSKRIKTENVGPLKNSEERMVVDDEEKAPSSPRDSIETGSVPQDWRIANVVPIFKKGSKSEPGNYRPGYGAHIAIYYMDEKKNVNTDFTIPNLVATIYDMFLGGAETTAITVNFGFLILAKHPEIQDKVHKEIDQVIGREKEPRADDRNHMPYTNAFLHEIQRYSDVIPMGVIRSTTRHVNFHGYDIPKGTDVITMLTTVLRDPSQFEKPEEFNVNHFLDENNKFKKTNAFMPFSAGLYILDLQYSSYMCLYIMLCLQIPYKISMQRIS
ncbi:unnamed protein product [Ranitomeya imitator]|uniref:Cytochrome P450 n=1 Tax=Ranitomeya imitator TaxID=111125 RepID=A0ABN9LDP3_9NEOB|nr:unnamed protein product [Ranitomeya imitator]